MQHIARLVCVMVLLMPLLLLPTTWRTGTSFYHPVIVVIEQPTGTVTLTKWIRYERR